MKISFTRAFIFVMSLGLIARLSAPAAAQLPVASLQWNASTDTDGDAKWENTGTKGGTAFDWSLINGPARAPAVTSLFDNSIITDAYDFNGTNQRATVQSFEKLGGNPTNNDASFEILFKPDSLTNATRQILFETGGSGDGTAMMVQGSNVVMKVKDGGVSVRPTYDLGLISPTPDDFYHVVGVVKRGSNQGLLYVNGELKKTVTAGGNLADWAGADGSGMARSNNTNAENAGKNSFWYPGQISLLRLYESALTDTQVTDLYQSILAPLPVFTWDAGGADTNWGTIANWDPDGTPNGTADTVLDTPNTITFAADGAANTLAISGGGTVQVTAPHALAVTDALTVAGPGSTLDVPGTLTAKTIDIDAGAVFKVAGSLTAESLTTAGANTIDAGGSVTVTAALNVNSDLDFATPGGVLTSAGASVAVGAGAQLTVAGLTAGGVNVPDTAVLDTGGGAVDVASLGVVGTWNRTGGNVTVQPGGGLNLAGSSLTVSGADTLTTAGVAVAVGAGQGLTYDKPLTVGGLNVAGALTLSAAAAADRKVTVAGGTMQVSAAATVTGLETVALEGGSLLIDVPLVAGPVADPANPLSHWKFDETTGSTVAVNSANPAYNGTVNNAQFVADGDRGQVLNFDGDQDWVDTPSMTDQGLFTDEISYAMWVNMNSVATGLGELMNTAQAPWRAGDLHLHIDTGNIYRVGVNGGAAVNGSEVFPIGEWHHVAFTYKTNGEEVLYFDGKKDTSAAANGRTISMDARIIGGWNGGRWLNAKLSDVMIFGRELTPAEVAAMNGLKFQDLDMTGVAVQTSGASTIGATGAASVAFGPLTMADGTLATTGVPISFTGTTITGMVVGFETGADTTPGQIDFSGGLVELAKTGAADLILDKTPLGVGGGTTIDAGEGRLVLLHDGVNNPLGTAGLRLSGGEAALTSSAGGPVAFDNAVEATADSTLTAGAATGGVAGPLTVTLGSASNGVTLTGGTLSVQTTDGYTLDIVGDVTGTGGLSVTGGDVKLTRPGGSTHNFGSLTTAGGTLSVNRTLELDTLDLAGGVLNRTGAGADRNITVSGDLILSGGDLDMTVTGGTLDITTAAVTIGSGRKLKLSGALSAASATIRAGGELETPGAVVVADLSLSGNLNRTGAGADRDVSVTNLTLGSALDMTGGGTLTAGGAVTVGAGGTLSLDESLPSATSVDVSPGGTLNVMDNLSIAPTANLAFRTGGTIHVAAGKELTVTAGSDIGALVPTAGLVGNWKLDDGSGLVAVNSATSGAGDGDLKNFAPGDAQWIAGVTGGALDFDGANDFVQVTGYKGITGTNPRTMSAWIKTTKNNADIVSWGQDKGGKKWHFRVQDSNGNAGAIRVEVNGGFVVGSTDLRDDQWHHVAAVLPNGAGNVNQVLLYVDGQLEANSATLGKAINTAASADFKIGSSHSNRYFQGPIDDVYLYGAALDAAGIQTLMNSAAGGADLALDSGATLTNSGAGMIVLGSVSGQATINSNIAVGGTVRPGDGVGTLSVNGNVTLAPGAAYQWEGNNAATDLVAVTGDLDLGAVWNLNIVPTGLLTGTHTLMTFTGALTSPTTVNRTVGGDSPYADLIDPVGTSVSFSGGNVEVHLAGPAVSSWTGGSGTAWDAPANWTAGIPTANTVAGLVPATANPAEVGTPGRAAHTLIIEGGTVNVLPAGELAVTNNLHVLAGSQLSVSGNLSASALKTAGTTTFSGGATVAIPDVTVTGGSLDTSIDLPVTTLDISGGAVNTHGKDVVVGSRLKMGATTIGITGGPTFKARGAALQSAVDTLTLAGGTVTIDPGTALGAAPAGSLEGYWSFDDAGDVGSDASGNGRDGTPVGDAAYSAQGKSGGALVMDGAGDRMEIGGYRGVAGTNSRTIAGWAKLNGSVANRPFLSWGTNSGGRKWTIRNNTSAANGTVGALRTEVNGGFVIGNTDLRDDQWHQFAVVLSDSADNITEVQLYVDGRLQTVSGSLDEPIDTAADRFVWIGGDFGNKSFNGWMDEVRIYSRALSAGEIAGFVAGPLDMSSTDVVVTADTTLVAVTPSAAFRDLTITNDNPSVTLGLDFGPSVRFRDVTTAAGAAIDGGVSVRGTLSADGSLDVGDLTMESGSTYQFDIGQFGNDRVAAAGNLSLEDTWTLNVANTGGGVEAGEEITLFTYGGALASSNNGGDGITSAAPINFVGMAGWNTGAAAVKFDGTRVYLTGISSPVINLVGSPSANWTTGGDWDLARVPTSSDVTNVGNGATVAVSGSQAAFKLNINSGTVQVGAGAQLAVGRSVNVAAGGSLNVLGGLETTTLNITGGAVSTDGPRVTLRDSLHAGDLSVSVTSGNTFKVGGAALETQPDSLVLEGGTVTLHNGALPAAPTGGLLAYYPFEEGTGLTTQNAANPGVNDGTLTNFVGDDSQWVAGKDGGAIHFSGVPVSDWVDGGLVSPVLTDSYTVALWVKADGLTQASQWDSIFSGGGGGAGGGSFQIDVGAATNGSYRFNGNTTVVAGPVTTDWAQVVITYDGTTVTAYYNGELANQAATSGREINQIMIARNRGADRYFAGTIDEVRVYDRALTAAEVAGFLGGPLAWGTTDISVTADTTLRTVTSVAEFGKLSLDSGVTLTLSGAPGYSFSDVSGDATVVANSLSIGGKVAPGASPGTLTLDADVTLEAGSSYEWQLGAGLAADTVAVSGDLVLESTWTLKLLDDSLDAGVAPADEFDLFTFGGTLTSANDTDPLTSDVNNDGVVDDSDLNLLLSAFGTTAFDLDGQADGVGVGDLAVLLGDFGREPFQLSTVVIDDTNASVAAWNTGGTKVKVDVAGGRVYLTGLEVAAPLAAQSVPEPGSLLLLVLGVLGILPLVRRRNVR